MAKKEMSLADQSAALDNLLFGKALPPHMARSQGGQILQRSKSLKESNAEVHKKLRDEVANAAAAKMDVQPLEAICFNHVCKCGHVWQGFGHYQRKVTERVPGAGACTFTKVLDYDPTPERPVTTEWRNVNETHCIKCFGGALPETPKQAEERIGDSVRMEQLRHMVRAENAAIREDLLNKRNAEYMAEAIKHVLRELPYSVEEAIEHIEPKLKVWRRSDRGSA